MRPQPWRRFGRPTARTPDAADAAEPLHAQNQPAVATDPASRIAVRLIAVEPWLAPLCALLLLLAPNPLIWPAAFFGLLPSAARLLTTGRLWRATPFDVPLVLMALGAALGSWASLSQDGTLIRLTGLLAAVLLFAAAREHAGTATTLRRLVPGLLLAAVIASALLLVMVGPFLLLSHVPAVASIVAAVDRWQVGEWVVQQDWLLQRYRFRASGVGAMGAIGLALAFAILIGQRGMIARVVTLLTIPLFLTLLIVADNRGAMVAGALSLGAMATVWRLRLLPLIPAAGILAILFLAFGPVGRGLSLTTLAQRFWFWENSLYLAREVPLTGAGLGIESVQLVYRAYFLPAYPPFSHAHSIYLQGLLEYGVFGFLGLLGLGLATLYAGWRGPHTQGSWTLTGRLAGFGIAATMLTAGLSEIVMLTTVGGAIALGGLGLLAATSDRVAQPSTSATRGRGSTGVWWLRVAVPAAAVVVLAVIMALTPLGSRVAARVLLNAGTADLNRGALSESIDKKDRESALERSVSTLRLAASFDAGDVTVQRNLALALAASDDTRRGRAAADRAKALTASDDRAALFQLGRTYTAINAWGEAIRAYQAAEAGPQLLQLGSRLLRARNLDQATSAYVAAARVDPTSRGAYEGVTQAVREGEGTLEDVIEALEPLLERPSNTEYGARLQAAQVYREAGRLRQASEQLVRAEEIGADPDLAYENARLLMVEGQAKRAVPLFQAVVEDQPYQPDGWLWLARAHAQLGQHEEAVEAIRRGLSKVDTSGQFAPAAAKLPETAAVRAVEIKRSERAPMLGVLAESLLRLGRTEEALAAVDEAVDAVPKDQWLAGVRWEARAIADGGPVNLVLNSTFDREGSWALRPYEWWPEPTPTTRLDEVLTFADGVGRMTQPTTGGRFVVQDVPGLEEGRRYRLAARVRGERLGAGSIQVAVLSVRSLKETIGSVQQAEATQWVTVPLETTTGIGDDTTLTIVIGFGPNTPSGAAIELDAVTLVPVDGPFAAATRRP